MNLKNIDLARLICDLVNRSEPPGSCNRSQIVTVPDRLGHDRRYAIDTRKIKIELNWTPRHKFDAGLPQTIAWYQSQEGELFLRRHC